MKKNALLLLSALLVAVASQTYAQISDPDFADSVKLSATAQWPGLSFEPALAGKIAGVEIIGKSGQTGSAFDIRIRNTASFINTRSRVLFIVDGIAVNSGDIAGKMENNEASPLTETPAISNNIFNTLAPSDIEDIVVLKDAAATAIYGEAGPMVL